MFTFRTSITVTVMTLSSRRGAADRHPGPVTALATQEAASAYMDAASTKALGRLRAN